LVILRVAVINEAEYEFDQHTPFALAEGVSQKQLQALRSGDFGAFDAVERDVLTYCDSMTREVHVPDAVFDAVRRHLEVREMVELTATVAAYNLVSRFLEALRIDHDH